MKLKEIALLSQCFMFYVIILAIMDCFSTPIGHGWNSHFLIPGRFYIWTPLWTTTSSYHPLTIGGRGAVADGHAASEVEAHS